MNTIAKYVLPLVLILSLTCHAQNKIEAPRGYTTQVGNLVSMLDDLKARVTASVSGLSQDEADFLLDENANRIGAMIYHLAATEAYYQVYTFENRGFNKAERDKFEVALNLGEKAREELKGKPIQYYLDIYNEVRAKTLTELKKKDDDWLNLSNKNKTMNYHWAWYHVMEHQANHMGQIRFLIKRIPKS